jgi:hypothetical protein
MKRIVSIDSKIQSLCAGDVELKESAKRVKINFLKLGVPKRPNSGTEFFKIICKIFRHGIFNQKLVEKLW